ncbi:MAG: hypothetical protein OHK0017_11280 [Patescibacteria group bacterium]
MSSKNINPITQPQKELLIQALRENGFKSMQKIALETAQNSIKLFPYELENYSQIGNSRAAGIPDLPPDFVFPMRKNSETEYMDFLCQINCSELAEYDYNNLLPHMGILSFFFCFDMDDFDNFKVYYFPDTTNLVLRKDYSELTKAYPNYYVNVNSFKLTFASEISVDPNLYNKLNFKDLGKPTWFEEGKEYTDDDLIDVYYNHFLSSVKYVPENNLGENIPLEFLINMRYRSALLYKELLQKANINVANLKPEEVILEFTNYVRKDLHKLGPTNMETLLSWLREKVPEDLVNSDSFLLGYPVSETESSTPNLINLLEFGSIDYVGLHWSDMGILGFRITPEDLSNLNFDKVEMGFTSG